MTNYVNENTPEYGFRLECLLLENKHDENFGNRPYFGLRLDKFVDSSLSESVQINDISTDKEQVLSLRNAILKNSVTPVTFYDVVDDWLNSKYSL